MWPARHPVTKVAREAAKSSRAGKELKDPGPLSGVFLLAGCQQIEAGAAPAQAATGSPRVLADFPNGDSSREYSISDRP